MSWRNGPEVAKNPSPPYCHRRLHLRRETEMHFSTKLTNLLFATLVTGLFVACKVGPNYHRPSVQTPTHYRDLQEDSQRQAQAASYADLPWWEVFQDQRLQELIRTALKQNYDLQLATERINAARAQLAITRSNLFPQGQGSVNFTGGKESNFQTKF